MTLPALCNALHLLKHDCQDSLLIFWLTNGLKGNVREATVIEDAYIDSICWHYFNFIWSDKGVAFEQRFTSYSYHNNYLSNCSYESFHLY